MSSGDERELQPLVGGKGKQRGCCVAHPVCCGCTLTVMMALSLIVITAGGVLSSILDHTIQDAIGEVRLGCVKVK